MTYLQRTLDWLKIHRDEAIAAVVLASVVFAYLLWNWFNVERVKTIAAVVQAFGFVIAAFLTYQYTMKLEDYKFDKRLKEIVHADYHKRSRESLEDISKFMAALITRLSMVPVRIEDPDNIPEPTDPDDSKDFPSRERYIRRRKIDLYHSAFLKLYNAEEAASIYLSDDLMDLLEQYRTEASHILGRYCEKRYAEDGWKDMIAIEQEYRDSWMGLRKKRRQVERQFKKHLALPEPLVPQ